MANFLYLVETGFHHIGQAGLKLLTSGDPPASASQSAGITGKSHHTQPKKQHFFPTSSSTDKSQGETLISCDWVGVLPQGDYGHGGGDTERDDSPHSDHIAGVWGPKAVLSKKTEGHKGPILTQEANRMVCIPACREWRPGRVLSFS
uniref:Uncharacterized protein n=1 Tax=Macaca mulatta TaxID=9544 RepID=A0A5F7ZIJ9_MACMU